MRDRRTGRQGGNALYSSAAENAASADGGMLLCAFTIAPIAPHSVARRTA